MRNNANRVRFLNGQQKAFIQNGCKGKSLKQFLDAHKEEVNVSYSLMKKYARGELTLPFDTFSSFCNLSGIYPESSSYEILPRNWGEVKGGKKGMKILQDKYPSEVFNSWRSKGRLISGYSSLKRIIIPDVNDKYLAELLGVFLGDGTFTKYFVRVSGDKRFDLPYFNYLNSIIKKTIGINSSIWSEEKRNTLLLDICSKEFCDFLHDAFYIKYGHKIRNKTIIPETILKNEVLAKACLRGLIDTDGSVAKDGTTLAIRFTSHNPLLLDQVFRLGENFGVFTFKSETQVGTRSKEKINLYFQKIGSSNLRHIVRFCESLDGNLVRRRDTFKYYPKYQNVFLPYGPVV